MGVDIGCFKGITNPMTVAVGVMVMGDGNVPPPLTPLTDCCELLEVGNGTACIKGVDMRPRVHG